jgi:hypothetical protein
MSPPENFSWTVTFYFLIQRIYILCPKDKSHYLKLKIRTVPVSWSKITLKSGILINRKARNVQGE